MINIDDKFMLFDCTCEFINKVDFYAANKPERAEGQRSRAFVEEWKFFKDGKDEQDEGRMVDKQASASQKSLNSGSPKKGRKDSKKSSIFKDQKQSKSSPQASAEGLTLHAMSENNKYFLFVQKSKSQTEKRDASAAAKANSSGTSLKTNGR